MPQVRAHEHTTQILTVVESKEGSPTGLGTGRHDMFPGIGIILLVLGAKLGLIHALHKEVLPYLSPSLSTEANIGPLSRLAPLISGSWKIWMNVGLVLWMTWTVAGPARVS